MDVTTTEFQNLSIMGKKKSHAPWQSLPHPPLPLNSGQSLICLLSVWMDLFWAFPASRIRHVAFRIWFLALSMTPSKFFRVVAFSPTALLFVGEERSAVWTYSPWLIHPSVDGRLGCFHFGIMVNDAPMKVHVQVVGTHVSILLGVHLRLKSLGRTGTLYFTFWGSVGNRLALHEASGDTGHASFRKRSSCSTTTLAHLPLLTSLPSFGFSSPPPQSSKLPQVLASACHWCANHSFIPFKEVPTPTRTFYHELAPSLTESTYYLLATYFLDQHRPPFFLLPAPNLSDLLGPTSNTTTHESSSAIPLSPPRSFFSEFPGFTARRNHGYRVLVISTSAVFVSGLKGLSSLHLADPLVTKKFPGCFKRCTVKK